MAQQARTTLGMIADVLAEIHYQKSGDIVAIDFSNHLVTVRHPSQYDRVFPFSLHAGYVRYRGVKRKYIRATSNLVRPKPREAS